MEKNVESIVKKIKKADGEKNNLIENYNKFIDLYGKNTTIVRFIEANLERPNNDLKELKNHKTELIEERGKLENELNELKEKREKAKIIGRQLLKEITQNEKNNVQKEEKEKLKYKKANYLSELVKELNNKVKYKEDLLKSIGESLEILGNYEKEEQDKLIKEALEKLYPEGNKTNHKDDDWKRKYEELERKYYESQGLEQQQNQENKVQNDDFQRKCKSKINSFVPSIKTKCINLFNKITKKKVYPTEQEENMSSEKTKKGRKQNIQMPPVDDNTIEKLAKVAKEIEEERQNSNSKIVKTDLTIE